MTQKITIKVIPNAKKNVVVEDAIDAFGNRQMKIKINAPPEDGKANEALLKFLVDVLPTKKSRLRLLSGHHSRLKVGAVAKG